MTKLGLTSFALAALMSVSAAHGRTGHAQKTPKAPEPTAEPAVVAPDPVAVQKWFSGAVDDILTNTDRTLNNLQGPAR